MNSAIFTGNKPVGAAYAVASSTDNGPWSLGHGGITEPSRFDGDESMGSPIPTGMLRVRIHPQTEVELREARPDR
jgi:hypothetical protein